MTFIKNKIFQAAIIVSIVLISSAIFISQTDRIFGKAAASPIIGTMVLMDVPSTGGGPMQYSTDIYLPGTSCVGNATFCYSGAQNDCKKTPLVNEGGGKYSIAAIGPSSSTAVSWSGSACESSSSTTQTLTANYYAFTVSSISSWSTCGSGSAASRLDIRDSTGAMIYSSGSPGTSLAGKGPTFTFTINGWTTSMGDCSWKNGCGSYSISGYQSTFPPIYHVELSYSC